MDTDWASCSEPRWGPGVEHAHRQGYSELAQRGQRGTRGAGRTQSRADANRGVHTAYAWTDVAVIT